MGLLPPYYVGLGLPWAVGLALLPFFFFFQILVQFFFWVFFFFFFWLESRTDNFFFEGVPNFVIEGVPNMD